MDSRINKLFLKLQQAKTDEERENIKKQIKFLKQDKTVTK